MAKLPESAKEVLREQAKRAGAVVCGVAPAGAFDTHAPAGHRPADLLPNAKSVVVVGGAAPRAGDWISASPWVLESMGTSDRINAAARRIAQFIESDLGYYALFVPPGTASGNHPFLSITLAAELAGLGSRSLAGPLLNRDHGFLYYSAVITTCPLEPDAPEAEGACPAPACRTMWADQGTTPCLAVCPMSSGGCLAGKLENGWPVRTGFDSARCNTRVHTHWIPGFQKVLEEALNEPDAERRKMLLYGDYFTRTLWAVTYSAQNMAQCFECMRVCPAAHGLKPLR